MNNVTDKMANFIHSISPETMQGEIFAFTVRVGICLRCRNLRVQSMLLLLLPLAVVVVVVAAVVVEVFAKQVAVSRLREHSSQNHFAYVDITLSCNY